MSYTKHNFVDGDTIYAAPFNAMEDQIAANETAIADLNLNNLKVVNTSIKKFMIDMKALVQELVYTKETNSGPLLYQDANTVIQKIDNSGIAVPICTILKNLSHCSISNNASDIIGTEPYSATLTAEDGYTLSSVSILMGVDNITSTVYNPSTGNINITSVTDNLVIAATATDENEEQPVNNLVETILFSNKVADGKFLMKAVPANLSNDEYFEAEINCTNVDDSGSGTAVLTIGEIDRAGYGSTSNSVTVFWRSGKALCRYKTAGDPYTTATKDAWVTVNNKQFTIKLDKYGFYVDDTLEIQSSEMSQMIGKTLWDVGTASSSTVGSFYTYISVYNQPSSDDNTLYRNYTASNAFSTQSVSANLANGDYIKALIDCTNVPSGTCVLAIGENGKISNDNDINAIRVIYNGPNAYYGIQYRVNGGNYTTVSEDSTAAKSPQITICLDSDGLKANGIASNSIKIAAAAMSQTMGVTNWEIGSPSSGAYYPHIIVHHETV